MAILSTFGAMTARGLGWLFQAAAGGPSGALYGWGYNNNGQLGTGNTTFYSSPVQVGAATNWLSTGLSAGPFYTLAIRS